MDALPRHFYDRPTLNVARDLLGCTLVHRLNGRRLSGRIVETEGYVGPQDLASHSRRGPTKANAVMFGPPGYAYVYFTYGMHWLLNAVTEADGFGSAVLLRAIEPLEGQDLIAANRPGRPPLEWTSGPAKLTKALAVDRACNGADLCGGDLFIGAGDRVPDHQVQTGPRIGIASVPEPWRSHPYRFWLKGNPYVSKSR